MGGYWRDVSERHDGALEWNAALPGQVDFGRRDCLSAGFLYALNTFAELRLVAGMRAVPCDRRICN
jgi:hypothetical protein